MHVMDGETGKTVKPSKYVSISWLRHCHMPGSSGYVKSLPFGRFSLVNFGTNVTHKRKIQVCQLS